MLRVVPDANRVAAALVRPHGWSWTQLHRGDVEFVAPTYLWDELDEHVEEYARKAGCSAKEMGARSRALRGIISSIDEVALLGVLDDPLVGAAEDVDPDDAPYVAALLATEADFLWTNDDALWRAFPSIAVRLIPDG